MSNSNNINQTVSVRNAIHHTPFTYTDAPEVACTLQFHNPRGTGIRHQRFDLLEDAPGNLGVKILQIFTR